MNNNKKDNNKKEYHIFFGGKRIWKCFRCGYKVTTASTILAVCPVCGATEEDEIFPKRKWEEILEGILGRIPLFLAIVGYYIIVVIITFLVVNYVFEILNQHNLETIDVVIYLVTYAIIFMGVIDLTHTVTAYHTKYLIYTIFFSIRPVSMRYMNKFEKEMKRDLKSYALHSLKIVSVMILMEIFLIIFKTFNQKELPERMLEFDLFVLFSLLGVAAIMFVLKKYDSLTESTAEKSKK